MSREHGTHFLVLKESELKSITLDVAELGKVQAELHKNEFEVVESPKLTRNQMLVARFQSVATTNTGIAVVHFHSSLQPAQTRLVDQQQLSGHDGTIAEHQVKGSADLDILHHSAMGVIQAGFPGGTKLINVSNQYQDSELAGPFHDLQSVIYPILSQILNGNTGHNSGSVLQ